MSKAPKFGTSKLAKAAGWFSRRHKTAKAHLEAKKKREDKIKSRR